MEFLEGLFELFELPGALFRKLVTSRDKTFDQILKDHAKNKLVGICVFLSLLMIIFVLILIV